MDTQVSQHDIKLIVVDIDGTLMTTDHKLSERNRKALKDAIAAGVQVMLATGKTRASAEDLIKDLGLNTPGVFVQGLVLYNADGSIRHQQTMEPAVVRRIITFAEDRGFEVILYSGSRLLVRHRNPRVDIVHEYGEPLPDVVGSLANQLSSVSVNKICLAGDPKRIRAMRWQLEQQISGQVSFTLSHVAELLEVLPPGASKGKGVKMILGDLGIAPDNVLAVGDGENDIEMLKLAGCSVAVDNAPAAVKAAAKYTVASNDNDGVAEAIERFVLAPRRPAVPAAPAAETGTPAASPVSVDTTAAPTPTQGEDKKE